MSIPVALDEAEVRRVAEGIVPSTAVMRNQLGAWAVTMTGSELVALVTAFARPSHLGEVGGPQDDGDDDGSSARADRGGGKT